MAADLAILVPVYHPYRWVAPFMQRALDEFWKDHPPVFFCGLQAEEAVGLEALPLRDAALPRDWAAYTNRLKQRSRGEIPEPADIDINFRIKKAADH